MKLAATDWDAIGSLSTAIAAAIALVGIFLTLWVYRRQNRSAQAVATRELIRTVLRDSRQIYDLTRDSVTGLAESQVHAFRKKLGDSADAGTFRKYFFQKNNFVVWSSFIAGYVASPEYSRLNHLWDEIDQSSTQLRGALRIFYYPANLIADNSRRAWYPLLGFGLADEMRNDAELERSWQDIDNLDTLTLTLATRLEQKLIDSLRESIVSRIEYMTSFVEDLWPVINKMSDNSLLRISADRKFDWHCLTMTQANPPRSPASAPISSGPPEARPVADAGSASVSKSMAIWNRMRAEEEEQEKDDLAEMENLLAGLEPVVPAATFTKLKNQVELCQKTYDPG